MAISNDTRGDTTVVVLPSVAAADTAAATSGWIDIRPYKGNVEVTHVTGAITGTLTSKLRTATDDSGTGAADIAGATFTAVSAANKAQTVCVPKSAGPYIQYVGTVVTGPVVVGVSLKAHPGV